MRTAFALRDQIEEHRELDYSDYSFEPEEPGREGEMSGLTYEEKFLVSKGDVDERRPDRERDFGHVW